MPGLKKTHSKTGRAKSDTYFSSYLGAHFFMVSLFSNLSTAHSHKTFFDQMIVVPPGSFGEIGRRPSYRRWRFHICSRETWIRQGEKLAERNCCLGKKNSFANFFFKFSSRLGLGLLRPLWSTLMQYITFFFYFLDFQSLRQMI